MSQVQVGGADLCDNLLNPDAVTAQTRNLNETNALTQAQSLFPSQKDEGGGLNQRTSHNNNGTEEEQGKQGYTRRGRVEDDEEEDIDELMKGVEEDEESEESNGLIRCQSPDTPMTDSSYSETGSLLETPYPFSPGTSPEPSSPLIPVGCPETAHAASQVEISQIDVKVDSHKADFVSTTLTATSDPSPPGPTCITEVTDKISENTDLPTGHLASSTEPVFSSGPTCARGFPPTAETFTVPAGTAMLNSAIASTPMSERAKPLAPTTWASTDSAASTGAMTSNWDDITSTAVPTGSPVSTCATGPAPPPALLRSLEVLAQRGDDTHFPLYLHQIAEALVLHKDYQKALWCIQLERLYHQRVLDNLNALQEQWESQCSSSFFDPATEHLDTLKNICRTHRRPGPRDAVCASLDLLRPTFEEGSTLSWFNSVHRVDKGMEQKAPDHLHCHSSHAVTPSFNVTDGLRSPEISENTSSDPDKEVEGGVRFRRDQATDKHSGQREGGEAGGGVEYTTSVRGNRLHPSTAGEIDQSKPAEPQGGALGPTQEKEAKRGEEKREVKKAAEALEMEDEEGEEEQERRKGQKSVCQKALPVDSLVCEAAEEKLHEEIQESPKTFLHQETRLPQEALTNQHGQDEEVKEDNDDEDDDEEEYNEVEQVDVIKGASSLDDMAKLITVEEVSPASGLVSILKKQRVCVDNISMSTSSESRPDKIPAKRRVRFKAPDDGYDQDVGGGDSCLLLFLLCLVTVVISVGGTALYCALGDTHSSVCQDFSRNADFYIGQLQSVIARLQLWFAPGS